MLIQSGLRIEEASELTALDILKRRMPDGSLYYMLHVKPSKFDRARVIPIGDGLGRVLAEILQHVKSFYGTTEVPFCCHWDHHERRPRPAGPYLLRGAKHPSHIGIQTIRGCLKAISIASGLKRSDGTPLVVLPHDCRRVFSSEHLNNNTPVHVIQALLGHATIDTVRVYAKLYPRNLVEEYRKGVRGLYNSFHGEDSLRTRPQKNGPPSKEAAACAIWERISAPYPLVSAAHGASFAWAASMLSPRKARSRRFAACWQVTNGRSPRLSCRVNRRGNWRRESSK